MGDVCDVNSICISVMLLEKMKWAKAISLQKGLERDAVILWTTGIRHELRVRLRTMELKGTRAELDKSNRNKCAES